MADKKAMRDMPHNLEAEQSLLGCILMDTQVQLEVTSSLKEDDFYAESHKYIFSAMDEIIKNNQPIDLVTLADKLEQHGTLEQAGGISYITSLTDVIPSTANFQTYLDIVQRDSMLRKLIKGSADIIDECRKSGSESTALAFAEKTVFDISNTADTSSMVKISSVLPEVMSELDELSKNKGKFSGIKTGFTGIDNLFDGLHKSDLIILAARPSVGKTTFAMNIVENIALQGYSCAVFSLEMSKVQLVKRMLCSVSGVSMEKVKRGTLDKTDWLKLAKARELLNNSKIFIDESSVVTPEEILSKCRRIKRKHGLDLVMIDYIQLKTTKSNKKDENRQQEVSGISRMLKILAKEVDVPVLALSQLSRAIETRKGRPQLSDLRESGAIEQDADIVMFIHRPDRNATEKEIAEGKVQKNVAEICVEKHRNGSTGLVKLFFKGECTKFINLNDETGEPEVGESKKADSAPKDTGYEPLPDAPPESEDDKPLTIDDEIF